MGGERDVSMASESESPIRFACPCCQEQLELPSTLAGRECCCGGCGNTLKAPAPQKAPAGQAGPAARKPPLSRKPPVRAPAPQPSGDSPLPNIQTGGGSMADVARQRAAAAEGGGAYAVEKKGIQAGVVGGLLMMLAAVPGSVIRVTVEGLEADEALAALAELVESRFGENA